MEEALRASLIESKATKRDYLELYEQFAVLAKHAKALQVTNDTLKGKYEKAKVRYKGYETQRRQFEDDVTRLEIATRLLEKRERDIDDVIQNLRNQLSTLTGSNFLLEKDNEDLRRVMQNEMISMVEHFKKVELLEDDKRGILKQIESMKLDMENNHVSKEEFLEIMNLLNEANSRNAILEQKIVLSERKEAEINGTLKSEIDKSQSLLSEVVQLQGKLAEARVRCEHYQQNEEISRNYVEKIMELESCKGSLSVQVGNLKNDVRRERDSVKPLQDQILFLKSRMEELESNCARNQDKINEYANDLTESRKQIQLLQLECENYRKNLEIQEEKYSVLISQKTEAEQLCEELYGKKSSVESELLVVRDENISLRNNLLSARAEIESLTIQITEFKNAVLFDMELGFESPTKKSGTEGYTFT